ncbi:hypothetical protein D3C73_1309660 [compost metagenome]
MITIQVCYLLKRYRNLKVNPLHRGRCLNVQLIVEQISHFVILQPIYTELIFEAANEQKRLISQMLTNVKASVLYLIVIVRQPSLTHGG